MDPVGGAASIITLAALSKDIVQSCKKYVKDFRDAPLVLSRFCNELETLTILFDRFLILQHTAQSGVLAEVLRRTGSLEDYESQLGKLKARINRVDLRSIGRRLLFPLNEHHILDGLNVVQRIRAALESALILDSIFHAQSTHSEVQRMSSILQNNHNQMMIHSLRREGELRKVTAILRDELPHVQSSPITGIGGTTEVRDCSYRRRQSLKTSDRTLTKKVFDLSFGRVSICVENSAAPPKFRRASRQAKRSRVAMAFFPSPAFWQTMIQVRLEWTARLDSLMAPMFSLQFLDIVQDDHLMIRASRVGDLDALETALSGQKTSPLCSTNAGWTPLHFAAAYGRTEACRVLIEQGAPLGATGFRGITPLHLAAHFGHLGVFKVLLRAGSDPDDYHENGMNAVFEILSNETISSSLDLFSLVKWLLHGQEQFLLDTQARDNSKRGILYYIAYPHGLDNRSTGSLTADQSETIDFVLRAGFKGDELDIHEFSVLHKACRDDQLDLVKLLLSGDCAMNATDWRGYTPLHYAVESRSFELVSILVRHGSDVDAVAHEDKFSYKDWGGRPSPLYLAAKFNWVEMVDFLIRHGAGYHDKSVSDAFRVAIYQNSLEAVQYFVENHIIQLDFRESYTDAGNCLAVINILYKAGVPLDDEDADGWNPLTWAAHCSYDAAANRLIELGANIDKMIQGLTPLGHAAKRGIGDIVGMLLAAGAQADLTGDEMPTPRQLAASNGYSEIADNIARYADAASTSKLLDYLPKDTADDEIDQVGAPPSVEWDLTTAVRKGDLEVLERLMEEGYTSEATNHSLSDLLDLAIIYHEWVVAEKLLKAGADVNECKSDTPLMRAAYAGSLTFIELMIENGANVNASDSRGSTPLLESLDAILSTGEYGDKRRHWTDKAVRIFLSAGANVNVIDDFRRTPLGKAVTIGCLGAVIALVEAGADLNRPSSQNSVDYISESTELVYRTPLAWAALNGHENVVKFLLDSGAEWRSLQKEPALTYTHRFLMQSWFPEDAEAPMDAAIADELLRVPSGDNTKSNGSQLFSHGSSEATSTSIDYYKSRRLYATSMNMARLLAAWIRGMHERLQSIRIEAMVFICVSVLLLARQGLQHVSIYRLADVKLGVLAILIGIFMASWLNEPNTT